MIITEHQHYLEPFDTHINSKVIDTDYNYENEKEDTMVKIFDEFQIKYFNQQTPDVLYEYFEEAIGFLKAENEFLCHASCLLRTQDEMSNGYNYGIMRQDTYALSSDGYEPDEYENMWIRKGWKYFSNANNLTKSKYEILW